MPKTKLYSELTDLTKLVTKETGYRVLVQKGCTLTNRIGKKVLSRFDYKKKCLIVFYNPKLPSPEYALAHELVKFLRVANTSDSNQLLVMPTKKGMRQAIRLMQKELKETGFSTYLSEHELQLFILSLLGLLVNTPGNFWISKTLYEYPQLKKESLKELRKMFSSKEIKMKLASVKRNPNTFLKAQVALDAAYALYLDKLWGKIKFFKPYEGTELEKVAVKLVNLNKKDKGYAGDIEVIQKWGKALGLDGFFKLKRM